MHKIQKARNSLSLPSQIRFHANNFRLANRQRKKKQKMKKKAVKQKHIKSQQEKWKTFPERALGSRNGWKNLCCSYKIDFGYEFHSTSIHIKFNVPEPQVSL